MVQFFKKYKLIFDILSIAVFSFGSIMYLMDNDEPGKKKMHVFAGVFFGIMAIFKLIDVIGILRNAKNKKTL